MRVNKVQEMIHKALMAEKDERWPDSLKLWQKIVKAETTPATLNDLGFSYKRMARPADALECFDRAMRLAQAQGETFIQIIYNRALLLYETSRYKEAEAGMRQCLEIDPHHRGAWQTLCCISAFVYADKPLQVLQQAKDWAMHEVDHLEEDVDFSHLRKQTDRKLSIGYITSDFRVHPISNFLYPVLRGHKDRGNVDVTVFYNFRGKDGFTWRMHELVQGWVDINQEDDEGVAWIIRKSQIDVLVDLNGHTFGNRLYALARRCAPVQVTWLGYMATTGMRAMDYRLTDRHLDPEGTQANYTEKLFYLDSAAIFAPSEDSPPVVLDTPGIKNQFITFGSANQIAKIGPRVFDVWSQILKTIPNARLAMLVAGAEKSERRQWVERQFEERGVSRAQLDIQPRRTHQGFLEFMGEIDIALDPFPYNGGTTTFHTIWQGCPVITLECDHELGRSSSGILGACGHRELVATTEEEYVKLAVSLCYLGKLTMYRSRLRNDLKNSILMKHGKFVRELEGAYEEMFQNWLTNNGQ